MSAIGGLSIILELLLGEVVFFYGCPRRNYFWLRVVLGVAICLAFGYFFPVPVEWISNPIYGFVRQFALLFAVVFTTFACFDLKFDVALALSTAGAGLQHIAFRLATILTVAFRSFDISLISSVGGWPVMELAVCAVVYVVAYFTIGRRAMREGYYKNHDKRLNFIAVVTILVSNVMTRFARFENLNDSYTVNMYAILCCLLALFVQFSIHRSILVMAEKKTVETLWQEERKQYEITKQTIDAINIKCHDMKHKIRDMGMLGPETKELLRIYDNSLKTGSPVLNVVIMDYGLRYAKDGVEITFMGDGKCMDFMTESEQYSLFGNAVSNATEAVLKLPDRDKRTIAITMEKKGEFVALSIANCFDGELRYEGGELVTSKPNERLEHGFGLKSMHMLAEKYGGELSISAKNGVFRLNFYFIDSRAEKVSA